RCRRPTHDQERDEKREFPPHEIADSPEYERPERTDRKTDGERRECFEKIRGWISGWIKLGGENRRETSKDVEVVPLDHRAGRRGGDDFPDLLRLIQESLRQKASDKSAFLNALAHYAVAPPFHSPLK